MQHNSTARRQYLRHPTEVPIDIRSPSPIEDDTLRTHDISYGGLSFTSHTPLKENELIELTIRVTQPDFTEMARVIWCHKSGSEYEIGVQFIEKDAAFRARMVEQVCHIEQYRRQVYDKENRELTTQEAAMEWISRHAAEFPGSH